VTASYDDFLRTKGFHSERVGFDPPQEAISDVLYDFQRDTVIWGAPQGARRDLSGLRTREDAGTA